MEPFRPAAEMPDIGWRAAYRMRWKRRRLLWRSWRSRHQLSLLRDQTAAIGAEDILAFVVLRNEATRLPYFLDYYRRLGVGHFLIIDNGSDDGSAEMLRPQSDVSLWQTSAGYKASRFGLDWLTFLLMTYGRDHWCLTGDAGGLVTCGGMAADGVRGRSEVLERGGQVGWGARRLDL